VAQVHVEHILLQIVKETSGYIQNVPSGHLAGHIVKAITMYPLITLRSKWWAHFESNLDEWLGSHAGHILSHILEETHGFFHKVPTGHLAKHIVKELNMYLLVTCWLNCLKNHNVITMETPGKWGSAPSVMTDDVLYDLLKMGILDWSTPNDRLNQTTPAMCHTTAMQMRMLAQHLSLEDKVSPILLCN